MENKKMKLKNICFIYIIIWLTFIFILSTNLKRMSPTSMPILLIYMIYYICILKYESNKIINYVKNEFNNVWRSINVSIGTNIFKWYKIIKKNPQIDDLKIVKKHLNCLVFLHMLHLLSFIIVPTIIDYF